MIIIGKSRAGSQTLGRYLDSAGKNERVQQIEIRGTVAEDIPGAMLEMAAHAEGTRCEKPLYHAMINPEPPYRLSPEQIIEAVNALEDKLNLTGHARVVVLHEKNGRQHIHVAWSRIDLEHMCAVSDSHNYYKHEVVSRDLERRFGHNRVQGALHERDGVERPERAPSRAELEQQQRTGITGMQVRAEVTAAFRASDGPEAFRAALEEQGYLLAPGDRRDFVIVDRLGGVHSLARRVEGMKAAQLREFMKPLDAASLPSVEEAKEIQQDRQRERGSMSDPHDRDDAETRAREERLREFQKAESQATAPANDMPDLNRHFAEWEDKLAASAIEKALREEEERIRRALELEASHVDAILERAYARGDDYVSQTRAALKDHLMRQGVLSNGEPRPHSPYEALSQEGAAPSQTPDERDRELHQVREQAQERRLFSEPARPANKYAELERSTDGRESDGDHVKEVLEDYDRARRQTREHAEERRDSSSRSQAGRSDNVEMTDAKAERLSRLLGTVDEGDHDYDVERDDWAPDRQREAPGGGRTRSR